VARAGLVVDMLVNNAGLACADPDHPAFPPRR
jgi:hypothetical protein